jgi:hypothetical protein
MRLLTPRVQAILALCCFPLLAHAQSPAKRYPVPPGHLPEEEEIAVARSAAPADVSAHADVYVLRGKEYVRVRRGTNACACMVAGELHAESR